MSAVADTTQIESGSFGLTEDGSDGWWIPLFVTDAEAQTLLDGYDPANQYSPSAAESRDIARVFLDALLAARGR
jgi:hypothetical protein|tara:strand:+ start:699 stop:920 length:222 start_codon:yes stop_codon:yes gene_type:complete